MDSDGDGYDDNTESAYDGCTMVGNRTEWLDHDRDCTGSNGDYNDSDPEIQTLEDHCAKYVNDSACSGLGDDIGQGNLTYLEEDSVDTMALVKDLSRKTIQWLDQPLIRLLNLRLNNLLPKHLLCPQVDFLKAGPWSSGAGTGINGLNRTRIDQWNTTGRLFRSVA